MGGNTSFFTNKINVHSADCFTPTTHHPPSLHHTTPTTRQPYTTPPPSKQTYQLRITAPYNPHNEPAFRQGHSWDFVGMKELGKWNRRRIFAGISLPQSSRAYPLVCADPSEGKHLVLFMRDFSLGEMGGSCPCRGENSFIPQGGRPEWTPSCPMTMKIREGFFLSVLPLGAAAHDTTLHGKPLCVTGHLWGKSLCHRWNRFTNGQWCKALIFNLSLDGPVHWTNRRVTGGSLCTLKIHKCFY